eukprot:5951616-Prymnesium_polylepis.1
MLASPSEHQRARSRGPGQRLPPLPHRERRAVFRRPAWDGCARGGRVRHRDPRPPHRACGR